MRFNAPNRFGVPDTEAYVHREIARLRDAIPKLRDAGKTELVAICEKRPCTTGNSSLTLSRLSKTILDFQITGEQLTLFGGQTE